MRELLKVLLQLKSLMSMSQLYKTNIELATLINTYRHMYTFFLQLIFLSILSAVFATAYDKNEKWDVLANSILRKMDILAGHYTTWL